MEAIKSQFERILMFLYLGAAVSVKKSDIIGIFDIDNVNTQKTTKDFLRGAEKEKKLIKNRNFKWYYINSLRENPVTHVPEARMSGLFYVSCPPAACADVPDSRKIMKNKALRTACCNK